MSLSLALALALFVLGSTPSSTAPEMTFKIEGVRPIPDAQFRDQMREARERVRAWWGATYEDSIAIEVDESRDISMALVPAWRGERGRMLFGSRTVDAGRPATVHEMIHVYAPNANRFLAEGLAVYGHDLLGGPPAYPNFGRDLDRLAACHATKEAMLTLERAATPAILEKMNKHGYVLAGSFVKFLIERHGMGKFRALYALTPLGRFKRDAGPAERWREVYDQDFDALVEAWLAHIRAC